MTCSIKGKQCCTHRRFIINLNLRWNGDPSASTKPMSRTVAQSDEDVFDEGDEAMVDQTLGDQSMNDRSPDPSLGLLGTPPHIPLPAAPLAPPTTNGHSASAGPSQTPHGFGTIPHAPAASASASAPGGPPLEHALATLASLTQSMMGTYVQLLKTQAQDGKVKLEYMRRREEREEEESRQRRDIERRRSEREQADWDHAKLAEKTKQKSALAQELLASAPDSSVKAAAAEYLKRLLLGD